MSRINISKKDLNKREKLQKEILEAQKQLEEIEEKARITVGTFVCEKFGSYDPDYLEKTINELYDLSITENASKGLEVKNENTAEYSTK